MPITKDEITSPDRDYHRKRAGEELMRAQSAAAVCARRAHLELLKLHSERMKKRCDADGAQIER
jgi:hypothetical protein